MSGLMPGPGPLPGSVGRGGSDGPGCHAGSRPAGPGRSSVADCVVVLELRLRVPLSPDHPGKISVIIGIWGSSLSVRLAIVNRGIARKTSFWIRYPGPGCRLHEHLRILSTTCACHGQRNCSISHMINKHPPQGHRGCIRPWFHTAMAMKGNIVCVS